MKQIHTVALIGMGAIGSFLGSHLKPVLGDNLRVIADGERRLKLDRDGMLVNGRLFHFHTVLPDEKSEPADLAIIITKMTELTKALEDIKNQIGPDTIIMTPLNGVESEKIAASVYGWERVIYSIARVSVVRRGSQVLFDDSTAYFEFGEKENSAASERMEMIKNLFYRVGIRPVIREDIEKAMWEKFACNVSENQVSAVLGLTFSDWGKSEHANALRIMAANEVIALARAYGIMIDEDYAVKRIERLNQLPPENKSSTLQDIENRHKTEVDTFAGTVVRLGKEKRIPTPVNEFLYHAIRVLEEKNDRE